MFLTKEQFNHMLAEKVMGIDRYEVWLGPEYSSFTGAEHYLIYDHAAGFENEVFEVAVVSRDELRFMWE